MNLTPNDLQNMTFKKTFMGYSEDQVNDIKKNANEKAENIIREAELKAQGIIEDANQKVIKINQEYEDLKKKLSVFRTRYESLLMSQLEILKQVDSEDKE